MVDDLGRYDFRRLKRRADISPVRTATTNATAPTTPPTIAAIEGFFEDLEVVVVDGVGDGKGDDVGANELSTELLPDTGGIVPPSALELGVA